jgi:cell division protein ZapE
LPTEPLVITPLARYDQAVAEHGLDDDPGQREAMRVLDELHHALLATQWRARGWRRLLGLARGRPVVPVRGVYLWGGVGRGKTMLMDMFFHCLPFAAKRRNHFHHFMNHVHRRLRELDARGDPLERIAGELAADTRIICFDEFFVADIADAMILGTLFEALFRRGVTLVATSNVAPTELYRDGLQRARFLPTIVQIERHTMVLPLDAGIDYRLRQLEQADVYQASTDPSAQAGMAHRFTAIAGEAEWLDSPLEVLGRHIAVRRRAEGIAWFEFTAICDGPRSQNDYIEIARTCHTVLVSNVPQLDAGSDNQARRFMSLVDEFYDRRVKLIITAAAPPTGLYQGERLAFEFRRTSSRLEEMRSHDYLAAEHRP